MCLQYTTGEQTSELCLILGRITNKLLLTYTAETHYRPPFAYVHPESPVTLVGMDICSQFDVVVTRTCHVPLLIEGRFVQIPISKG